MSEPPTPPPATSDLPAADNAAIMMMLLDEDQTSRILSELEPEELRRLGEKMCALGEIGPDVIAEAIAGFVSRTEALGLVAHDRVGQVRGMFARAVGEVKADNMMRRILPGAAPHSTLELARWLTPESLVPLVRGEHPQAIAVLLVQLDPEVAAAVLHALPAESQPEIVHRIATLGPVSPQAIMMLEELLARRITECHGQRPLTIGGAREAAEIINGVGKVVEKRVLGELTRRDKLLARRIEDEMFKFEHLFVLDPKSMGTLLRDVPNDSLIDALKGVSEDEREHFFRAMSSRAADGVKDEIVARGRTRLADVVAAQKEIVAIARRLAADGAIAFGSGDDDYV
ncbi:flagellar motor switch protein FliG [Novosphingobium aerophilum]|uniref:flagellar motor switch protein FliG n=1 Tax=Novosphingobium TaxID=165696 RepID=UPI0006C8B996|nr:MULTISPECIES: flagellar motor switch protein FliG [unclassified Novosphingobium]KPH64464.1 flagellar motor switch protein FliG [Novosphingobium sp. ST904]TCM31095.1 flagellar motor switch protein FliG [Novosphingobium sp. ST904]WRT93540.1 flagellar motor switch protein FliG [Novosphingobium sp. RL4]